VSAGIQLRIFFDRSCVLAEVAEGWDEPRGSGGHHSLVILCAARELLTRRRWQKECTACTSAFLQ
jgi:hypothetical protein